MSASLVGSEMCIRDRTSRESSLGAALEEVLWTGAVLDMHYCIAARVNSCLLYTSDAADDM
eukprot:1663435-Alexandrium_andersonii.AAC.1